MSYGMYGRKYGMGLGLGLGPNLSPYCRWFPGMPRGWWTNPNYMIQTPTSLPPVPYPLSNIYPPQNASFSQPMYQQSQLMRGSQQLGYNPSISSSFGFGRGIGSTFEGGFGRGRRYRGGRGYSSQGYQY